MYARSRPTLIAGARLSRAAAALTLLLPLVPTFAAALEFLPEEFTIDTTFAISAPVFDSEGRMHTAYPEGSTVTYMMRDTTGTYVSEQVNLLFPSGQIEIAVDSGDEPHIAMSGGTFLRHAEKKNGVWQPAVSLLQFGYTRDIGIAIHDSDEVHLAYSTWTNELGYSVRSGGVWTHTVVDTLDARDVSLDVDSNGRPGIAYKTKQGGFEYHVKYAFYDTSWTIEHLDTTFFELESHRRKGTAVRFDSLDRPNLIWTSQGFDGPRHGLKDAGAWSTQDIETNKTGDRPSLAIDDAGKLHVSYRRSGGDLAYATDASGTWEITTIEPIEIHGGIGVNGDGHPQIVHADSSGGATRFYPLIVSETNMTLVSRTGDPLPVQYNECWGYVGTNGEEYAVIGDIDATAFYRVTDPANPVLVGTIPGYTRSTWRDIKDYVHGSGAHYVFVSSEMNGGIQVVDVTNPDAPVLLYEYGAGSLSVHNLFVEQASDRLYACGPNNGGIIIHDIAADPESLSVVLGQWHDQYIHDAFARNDTVFAACIYSGEVRLLDATNPANIQTVLNISWAGSFPHNVWPIEADPDYILTTDENAGGHVRCWDISDPQNVTQVSEYQVGGPNDIVHNVFTSGSTAYISYYKHGTHVVDFSDPSNPLPLGSVVFEPQPTWTQFPGTWGVYPFLPSGTIVSSDRSYGLYLTSLDITVGVAAGGATEDALDGPTTLPPAVRLAPNSPNPFNPTTKIAFRAPGGPLELVVHDLAGRVVRTLAYGHHGAGEHTVVWDGRDDRGREVASGIYFSTLRAGRASETRKMHLVR